MFVRSAIRAFALPKQAITAASRFCSTGVENITMVERVARRREEAEVSKSSIPLSFFFFFLSFSFLIPCSSSSGPASHVSDAAMTDRHTCT